VSGGGRASNPADFLWLLLPLPRARRLLEGRGAGRARRRLRALLRRSVRAGMLVAALLPVLGLLVLAGLESRR
jgi:hypothetical protein